MHLFLISYKKIALHLDICTITMQLDALKSILCWCKKYKSDPYHGLPLCDCDIYTSFFFPPLYTHTITPTHSIRAIISTVAGSNKAVIRGRRVENGLAKSSYLTQDEDNEAETSQS